MSISSPIPPLLSAPRITTLVASLLVALCSGTNYVYSAYSPQLGARLRISHTQLNIVALAGNVGVYSSGPVWGRIVDTRGPRILLICAFILLLSGYSGIRRMFDAGLPEGAPTLSALKFILLVACSYMTGAGGNGGLTSSVNSTAKTFPDRARASTTGLVISGFGLSAFLFSTIAHAFYAGNTSAFLLLLSLGTSFPMIMGLVLVRPITLPPSEVVHTIHPGQQYHDPLSASTPTADSRTRLLDSDDLDERILFSADSVPIDGETNALELSPSRRSSSELRRHRSIAPRSSSSRNRPPPLSFNNEEVLNIYGRQLFFSGDFWLLFSILSMLSGTGLMYINNVGSMSQALFAKNNPKFDEIEAAKWQATQVSSISLMNFAGRIFIGLISDFGKNQLKLPRSYSLVLASFFFFVSQVAAAYIEDVQKLWIASALLGLAHGSVFSLFPTVCIEWFGMPHFSENWGYLSMSPMLAGNMFSVIFGRNLDAHEVPPATSSLAVLARNVPPDTTASGPLCLQGLECYVDTLRLTIAATFLSILLSIGAGWRERQKIAAEHQLKLSTATGRSEAVWEESA